MATNELLDAALSYARLGWRVFPLGPRSKVPLVKGGRGVHDATTDEAQITTWWSSTPDANVGIATGQGSDVVVVDVDPPDGETTLELVEAVHGALPETVTAITGGNGWHYLFEHHEPLSGRNGGLGDHVDVKADGGYIVAPPSIHDRTGAPYEWTAMPGDVELAPLPGWVVETLAESRVRTAPEAPARAVPPLPRTPGGTTRYANAALAGEVAELAGTGEGRRNDQLNIAALKIGRLVGGGQIDEATVRAELHIACERNGLHADDGWKTCDDTITSGLKKGMADPKYPDRVPAAAVKTRSSPTSTSQGASPDSAPPGSAVEILADGFRNTDAGNANRFVAAAEGRARYVHAWGKWIVYDASAGVWRIDLNDALVTEKAKSVAGRLFATAIEQSGGARDALLKHAKRCESSNAIGSMIRLARGMDGVLVRHEQLDAAPWLLNVLNGTVDLRSGQLRAHDPDDLLTVQAPTVFDPDAKATLWQQCLRRWQPDDAMRRYLQQMIGTGSTGHPIEHLFINLGPGGNGKGKFYGAVADVLGDYVMIIHKSLITVQKHEQHDTVKARLFGARLAIASETDASDRLDEAKVKELTGGDLLEARRMREDPWKFRPTHTMAMHTNHKPKVRGVDEGVWRRIRLIPWEVSIPLAEQDTRLAEKLQEEAAGILNWIVAGAIDWHEHGFVEPESVVVATTKYRASQDSLAGFLDEMFDLVPGHRESPKTIYEAYERWCEATGESPMTKTALGAAFSDRGFDLSSDRRYRVGLRLLDMENARDVIDPQVPPVRAHTETGTGERAHRAHDAHDTPQDQLGGLGPQPTDSANPEDLAPEDQWTTF